jgi:hypothetical protein
VAITLAYNDDNGTLRSMDFEPRAVAGLTEPDETKTIQVVHDGVVNATRRQQTLGFNKVVSIVIPPGTSRVQRMHLAAFIDADEKWIYSDPFYPQVNNLDGGLKAEWLRSCEHGRQFTIRLIDVLNYRKWDDGPILDTDMYYTAIVKITGTLASPQTFTTNVSPITVDIWGNPFPAFNGTTQKLSVLAISAAYSQFVYCQIGEVTVSGGNATWQGFASDFGTPADDGNYYVKFTISVQTTT